MEGMRQFPDGFFDLAVVDPPYGINITGRHRSKTVHVERERESGRRESSEAPGVHSAAKVHVYGESKKALTNQNFIMRSTIAPRRTLHISGSLHG
jgi:DNA modification methylase